MISTMILAAILINKNMTKQIKQVTGQINLVKDKVYQANNIINILHFYTNINNEASELEMLEEVEKEIELQREIIQENIKTL